MDEEAKAKAANPVRTDLLERPISMEALMPTAASIFRSARETDQKLRALTANQRPAFRTASVSQAGTEEADGVTLDRVWAEARRLRKADPHSPYIPAPEWVIGSPLYYQFRWYVAPLSYKQDKGHEYLLEFGKRNIEKFIASAHGASPKYQKFVEQTKKELQVALEDALRANSNLAADREALLETAFDTHDGAYRLGGFGELDLSDQIKAAQVPELEDAMSLEAVKEIMQARDLIRWDQAFPFSHPQLPWGN